MKPDEPIPPPLHEDRLSYGSDVDPALFDALFAAVSEQTVAKAPTARDRLRELPSTARVMLASLGLSLLIGVAVAVAGVRPDLGAGDLVGFGGALIPIAAVTIAAIATTLRGAHLPARARLTFAVGTLAVSLPLALVLVPGLWPGGTRLGYETPLAHVGCAITGLLSAVGAAGLVLSFTRATSPRLTRLFTAGGAGGLAGFAILQLHCPVADIDHLLLAHAPVGLAAGLVLIGAVALIHQLHARA